MKSLKKPQGTLALIGEGVPVDSISLGGYDLDDPESALERSPTRRRPLCCQLDGFLRMTIHFGLFRYQNPKI